MRHLFARNRVGRIVLCWTCCEACHSEHKNLFAARLHWLWLRLTRQV